MNLLDKIVLNAADVFDGGFTVAEIRTVIGVEYNQYWHAQIRKVLDESKKYSATFDGKVNIYTKTPTRK